MINRILVAVDLADMDGPVPMGALSLWHLARHRGAPVAEHLLAEAIALASTLGATLEIAYVRQTRARRGFDVSVNEGPDEVDDWIDRELTRLWEVVAARGVSCMTTSLEGSVPRALARHVERCPADLVVLGRRARWHVFPGRAEHVLLHASRRVLVIPPVSPSP
jgi:nucleotide-binding universal stress UspA family protein